METKRRAWVLTLNNYTAEDESNWITLGNSRQVRYLVFGREVGVENHVPHLQGYIYFHNPKYWTQTIKFLDNERIHIEAAMGTPEQNTAYCTKDDSFQEIGEPPQQGKRADIAKVKKLVKEGKTMPEIIEDESTTSYQSLRCAELLMKYTKMPERDEPPHVTWICGPTGLGKTRMAFNEAKATGLDIWKSAGNLRWWEGYYGQKCVIIDEFRRDFCKFHELLQILDRYPLRVETKGSSCWLRAKFIWITSCSRPEDVYNTREDLGQLLRRIHVTKQIHEEETATTESTEEQKSGV